MAQKVAWYGFCVRNSLSKAKPCAVSTLVMIALCLAGAARAQTVTISIGWDQPQRFKWDEPTARTIPALQVVSNPLLKRDTVTHDSAYAELKRIKAEYVRFVPWYWFGYEYAVVESLPPSGSKTYWDFSHIDPLVIDFMAAQEGRSVIMNFSTIPAWVLKDSSYKLLGDYYSRLLSWYEKGGFTDELGVYHSSGYHYKFDYWEAFNESDLEGNVSAPDYCRRYDTLVTAMRRVDSTIKFCGPALANFNYAYYQYFLDPLHHKSGIPIDIVTHHHYCSSNDYFAEAENQQVFHTYACNALRDNYRPNAKTDCDEMGTFSIETGYSPADPYWCYSGAVYAYQYAQMCLAGADIAGMSQLMAQPGNFPDVSMLDWNTGRANARARVLELLIRETGPGDSLVAASASDTSVFALGFITPAGEHKALVVNKTNVQHTVAFPQVISSVKYVDVTTNRDTVTTYNGTGSNQLIISGYAVWVATFAPATGTSTGGTPQISNGSFETPVLAAGSFRYRVPGSGWNFISQAGISGNNSAFTSSNPVAPDGAQVLILQNYGRAQQWVTLNAGTYRISLRAAQRGAINSGNGQTFAVRVDGKEIILVTPSSTSYSTFTTDTFSVTMGQHVVELRGLDPNGADNTAFVDMVSLSTVSLTPVHYEPKSNSLMSIQVTGDRVTLSLPKNERAQPLTLRIFDIGGRLIGTLMNITTNGGGFRISLYGKGTLPAAHGVYILKILYGKEKACARICL